MLGMQKYVSVTHTFALASAFAPEYLPGAFLGQKFILAFRDHDGGKRTSTASPDDAKAGKEE